MTQEGNNVGGAKVRRGERPWVIGRRSIVTRPHFRMKTRGHATTDPLCCCSLPRRPPAKPPRRSAKRTSASQAHECVRQTLVVSSFESMLPREGTAPPVGPRGRVLAQSTCLGVIREAPELTKVVKQQGWLSTSPSTPVSCM